MFSGNLFRNRRRAETSPRTAHGEQDEATKLIYKEGPNHEQQQQLLLGRLHTQLMATPSLCVALEAVGGASQRPSPPLHRLPRQDKEALEYLLQSVFWSLPAFV